MAGHRDFSGLRNRMSPQRRSRNQQAVQEELERMLLAELRRAAGKTQVEVAESMGITQPTLSHLESQDDMQIGTLQRIVEALGGELEITAKLPTGRVSLSQFSEAGRKTALKSPN